MESARLPLQILNASIWACLGRRGLVRLSQFDGNYVGGLVWANGVACLIMGVLTSSTWPTHNKKPHPIHVGLTSGFCGTLSSFSSLVLELFTFSANTSYAAYPNPGYGVMAWLLVLFVELAVSSTAYTVGRYIGSLLPRIPDRIVWLEKVFVLMGIAAYIANAILIGLIPSWRSWTFSVLMAPPGALARYYLSSLNTQPPSSRWSDFPIGTFIANVLATLLLAIFTLLNQNGVSHISCQVLSGLDDGFCGTLSTISTFIVELHKLRPPKAALYGAVSLLVSFALVVITLGSYIWIHGFLNLAC